MKQDEKEEVKESGKMNSIFCVCHGERERLPLYALILLQKNFGVYTAAVVEKQAQSKKEGDGKELRTGKLIREDSYMRQFSFRFLHVCII